MRIELQETTGAFSGDIPESAWCKVSEHRKVATALAAKQTGDKAMRERCGPSAWDSHRRLINAGPLRIRLHVECHCQGAGLYAGGGFAEGCAREATVYYFWEPGESMPPAPKPEGWYGHTTCRACRDVQATWERRDPHTRGGVTLGGNGPPFT